MIFLGGNDMDMVFKVVSTLLGSNPYQQAISRNSFHSWLGDCRTGVV